MAQVIITINFREYAISCDNGQEAHIMKLARGLDEKAKMLTKALGHINENQLLAMVGLLTADELSEMKKAEGGQMVAPTIPQQEVKPVVDEKTFQEIDEELSLSLNSLNEMIKSVASQIKVC